MTYRNPVLCELGGIDANNVEIICKRIERLERAERDPHVRDWSGAYYSDVYFLLGLVGRLIAERNNGPST